MTVEEHVAAGHAALEAGRWEEARNAFEAALAEQETPEALDGIGRALWWLGDTRQSVEYSERAYVEFRRAGDVIRASTTAMSLCVAYVGNFGNHAAARGWIARAERVLQGTDPGPLQGWLWSTRGYVTAELDASLNLLERALRFARETGDVDLELCTLADIGERFVMAGKVQEGLELIDEAMAGTLAGEHTRLDTVVFTCCDMLVACDLAGDLERATQWCRIADRFIRDYGCPFLFATCRTLYGSILVAKGRWAEGEQELASAIRMTENAGPALHAEALARLADLRLRQGRLEEAEELLAMVDDSIVRALPAATVRLARGEPAVAVMTLERRLNLLGERPIEGAPILAMLVEAHIALGDTDAATKIAARLEAESQIQDRRHTGALAILTSGRVAAAKGQVEDAIALLERALDEFVRLDLPLETGRVRLELARGLALRRPELAIAEAKSAFAVFDELGAGGDANEAASLLRSLGITGRTGPKRVGALTKREEEVLRLVGIGLSNPEIAQRLFISRKTAAHHVSNLLAKLGLRNRAEAVAYAARTFGHPSPK